MENFKRVIELSGMFAALTLCFCLECLDRFAALLTNRTRQRI
jgi:hypothetical protein